MQDYCNGTIAGLIASWSISTAIAIAEVVLGLKISTFYSILGLSSGLTDNYVSCCISWLWSSYNYGNHIGSCSGIYNNKIERINYTKTL